MKRPKFEDYLHVINAEIQKKKYKWNLTSLSWIDYDDVAQIIRIHIFKKWKQYDSSKPIEPWISRIIHHQISNLIRNVYLNSARPCLRCDAAQPDNGCKIYSTQCVACPLYKHWSKGKKYAHDIKMPLPIENHVNEVYEISDDTSDMTNQVNRIHEKMKQILKPIEYKVYEGLFILHEDEEVVAKKIGYITNENGRSPGYKQIKNIRKISIQKYKKAVERGEIDIY